MQLQLHVRTLAYETCVLTVSENDFAEIVFKQLEIKYGIPSAQQRVLYEGYDGSTADLQRGRRLKEFKLAPQVRLILAKVLPAKPKTVAPDLSSEWQPSRRRAKARGPRHCVNRLPPRPRKPAPTLKEVQESLRASEVRVSQERKASPAKQPREVPSSPTPPNRPVPRVNNNVEETGVKVQSKTSGASAKAPSQAPLPKGGASANAAPWAAPRAAPTQPSHSWSPPITGSGVCTPKAPPDVPGMMEPPTSSGRTVRAATPGAPPVTSTPFPGSGSATNNNPGVTRIRRCDLQRIGRLGVGAFGLVTLEADRRTGRTYALKAVSKGYLAHLRMEYSVLNEKRILKMLDTPFVVRLLATYSGREHVYFLLEAALGGELFTTYERLKLYGSETHARFYVSCVTEALTHLHGKNVIYRDLKPENLLLDNRGFCKVTDMGLAKVATSPTFTMVGTPDYMAPEVIEQVGHTKSVDWWTLGVLLFELLAGHAPFESKSGNAQETYGLVKKGIESVRFPEAVKIEAGQLVRNLCHRNPDVRLRTPQLRDNVFFRGFDWKGLQSLRISPPLVPQVRGPRDLTNFRDCEHEDPQAMPYQDTGSGWDIGFEDDVLSVGATAAAAAAPMLQSAVALGGSTPSGTPQRLPATASTASSPSGYRAAAVGASPQATHTQQRRLLSPPCSPRSAAQRPQTARVQGGVANAARNAWQAHADRKMATGAGSFVPPIIRSGGGMQSPPSSPVLGGG
ncbi:PRKG1 [Symbiodinium sp. CCMP2456]|nr:PRKG1 [Symbiodinium sp. CCMP2456]